MKCHIRDEVVPTLSQRCDAPHGDCHRLSPSLVDHGVADRVVIPSRLLRRRTRHPAAVLMLRSLSPVDVGLAEPPPLSMLTTRPRTRSAVTLRSKVSRASPFVYIRVG
jgi:hypothetical protein